MKTKFKKIIAILLCLVMAIPVITIQAFADDDITPEYIWDGTTEEYAGGSGTESDPYQIANAKQLAYMAQKSLSDTFSKKFFILTNDIYLNDISDYENWTATTAGLNKWTPMGKTDASFRGVFDGDGHTIYGMYIVGEYSSNIGLFSYVGVSGSNVGFVTDRGIVRNLRISNSYINATATTGLGAGAVAGRIDTGAQIENVSSNTYIRINNLATAYSVGGIVGTAQNSESRIVNCINSGVVEVNSGNTDARVGGIVGTLRNSKYACAEVFACCNTGDVIADVAMGVGGIVGYTGHEDTYAKTTISNCYNMGSIISNAASAGILGYARSAVDIKDCFNLGNASKQILHTISNSSYEVNVSGCYYNSDLSAVSGVADTAATALSYKNGEFVSENMTNLAAFSNSMLDTTIWELNVGEIPTLKNLPKKVTAYDANAPIWDGETIDTSYEGSGTQDDPYKISTAAELAGLQVLVDGGTDENGNTLSQNTLSGKYYKLTNDIYLNDISNYDAWESNPPANEWTPIGKDDRGFRGVFDGDGHTVYGMYIEVDSSRTEWGLFGYCRYGEASETPKLKNLNVTYSYINSNNTAAYVGGIVGRGYHWSMTNCSANVKIKGNAKCAGGVVGYLGTGSNYITYCANYADINVTVTSNNEHAIGGVVGYARQGKSSGYMKYCANMGDITGSGNFVSGLIGINGHSSAAVDTGSMSISHCINTGTIINNLQYGQVAGITSSINNCTVEGCINIGSCIYGYSSANTNYSAQIIRTANTNGTATTTNCFYNSDLSYTATSGKTTVTNTNITGLSFSSGDFNSENMANIVWNMAPGKMPTLVGLYNPTDSEVLGAQIREAWTEYYSNGVKIAEGQGIRFGATVAYGSKYMNEDKTSLKDGYTAGIKITALGSTYDIKAEKTFVYNEVDDTITFTGYIVGIGKDYFDTNFAAKAYVMNGNMTLAISNSIVRTVRQVAAELGGSLNDDGSYIDITDTLEITAMSFNIRGYTADQEVDGWSDGTVTTAEDKLLRANNIINTITEETPDSFGLQEFNIVWVALADSGSGRDWSYGDDLSPSADINNIELIAIPGYKAVGKSNEGVSWHYNAIFYDYTEWELVTWGTKWLSSTPDVACSADYVTESGEDFADCSRTVTYAVLKNIATGQQYIHFNTHITIADSNTYRIPQVQYLNNIINSVVEDTGVNAYIVTGDFNMESTNGTHYAAITKLGNDAAVCATEIDNTADLSTNNSGDTYYIDYILVSDGIYAKSFERKDIVTKKEWTNAGMPESYYVSDHNPLVLKFHIY